MQASISVKNTLIFARRMAVTTSFTSRPQGKASNASSHAPPQNRVKNDATMPWAQ